MNSLERKRHQPPLDQRPKLTYKFSHSAYSQSPLNNSQVNTAETSRPQSHEEDSDFQTMCNSWTSIMLNQLSLKSSMVSIRHSDTVCEAFTLTLITCQEHFRHLIEDIDAFKFETVTSCDRISTLSLMTNTDVAPTNIEDNDQAIIETLNDNQDTPCASGKFDVFRPYSCRIRKATPLPSGTLCFAMLSQNCFEPLPSDQCSAHAASIVLQFQSQPTVTGRTIGTNSIPFLAIKTLSRRNAFESKVCAQFARPHFYRRLKRNNATPHPDTSIRISPSLPSQQITQSEYALEQCLDVASSNLFYQVRLRAQASHQSTNEPRLNQNQSVNPR